MSAPLLTPASGGGSKPKPAPYDPLPSIQTPKPEPQESTVPLVVITAFDADTAEALKKRLEETIHPVDRPTPARQKETYDPLSSIMAPEQSNEPSLPDIALNIKEPEMTAADLEMAWSSEAPFLSLDAAEMSDYFSALEDDLLRDVSISLQHQKFILYYLDDSLEYLKHFATYTWDEDSDAAAEEFIQRNVERFKSELERQREHDWSRGVQNDIEYWIRNVANDERESVIVYDLEAGEILFVRYGDKDSVTMQEWQQKLAEGRNIVVIHNHPNNSGASWADLSAAVWLDAEYMIVVKPDGTQHHQQRIGDRMVALEPIHNPDYVAPADPLEMAAASIAYWIQTLREFGNPPESLWWQEGNIIVPYHTDESIEDVAARMIGPLPDPVRDEDNYAELLKEHQKDSAEFTSYLKRLNQSNTEPNVMYIPMPGWSGRKEHTPRGAKIIGSHASRRTFLRTLPSSLNSPTNLGSRWNRLSQVEQRIEMALTSTADDALIAIFDNIQSVESAFRWIEDNNDFIEKYATNASIPKELLQVILASEILYDYGTNDSIQDKMGRAKLTTDISWRGPGVGNVHYVTLMDAYIHLDNLNQADIWQLDPDAPVW